MKRFKSWRRRLAVLVALSCLGSPMAFAAERPAFMQGGDVSELTYLEDNGATFYDEEGRAKDCLQIVKESGWNIVRIRYYNEPGKGHGDGSYYCPPGVMNKEDVLRLAKRATDMGMDFEFSFHYSDYWTNGAVQIIPVEWQKRIEGMDKDAAIAELEKCVYENTKEMLQALKAQGTIPPYVSLGNEIQSGMLFPYGYAVAETWPALARFFNAGAKAVREELPETKIILHLDDAGNDWKYDNFFGFCKKLHVDYDVIGASYYPFFTNKSAHDIAEFSKRQSQKFHKPVMLMETGFAFDRLLPTGGVGQLGHNGPYADMTREAQAAFMDELFTEMKKVPAPYVLGDLYWDPIMIEQKGVGWAMRESDDGADVNVVSNTTFFDYDGTALPALKVYGKHLEGAAGEIVSGHAAGSDGHAQPGITVQLTAGGQTLTKTTDRYGNFMFSEVAAGEAASLTFSGAGYEGVTLPIGVVGEADTTDLATVTMKGRALTGRVTDDYGAPLAGAAVKIKAAGFTYVTKTDAAGVYTLKDLPADTPCEVEASLGGHAASSGTAPGAAASETAELNLTLPNNSGTLSGTVLNTHGAPVADVLVTATGAGGTFSALTDDHGEYTIYDVTAGDYTLTTERVGFLPAEEQTARATVRGASYGHDFTILKNLFEAKGTVFKASGQPAAGATVTAETPVKTYTARTDEDGHYHFKNLTAGTWYTLRASEEGSAEAYKPAITGEPGEVVSQADLYIPVSVPLKNPSFEEWGRDRYDIVGWKTSGTPKSIVEQGQSSKVGKMEMAFWNDHAYQADVWQEVDLPAGHYSFSAWVMNGGGQNSTQMYIVDAKGEEHAIDIYACPSAWCEMRIYVDELPAGATRIGFRSDANAANWICFDDIRLVRETF